MHHYWPLAAVLLLTVSCRTAGPERTLSPPRVSSEGEVVIAVIDAHIELVASVTRSGGLNVPASWCVCATDTPKQLGVLVSDEFITRLRSAAVVRRRRWCEAEGGRAGEANWLSVGPVHMSSPERATVWSVAWYRHDRGGLSCLLAVEKAGTTWVVGDTCLDGESFN